MSVASDPESVRVAAVRQWSAKAATLIDARIGDARAHAWNAITHRVAKAADGRKTWQAALSTRSYKAAAARLAELADALAGPTRMSLDGLIRDARAAFYRSSFDLWTPDIPAELLAPNPHPTKAGERIARGLVLHGFDLRSEVADVIDAAIRGLAAVATVAGNKAATDAQARDLLDGWETQKRTAIRNRVEMMLSDGEAAVFNLVGREMIDPEYRA